LKPNQVNQCAPAGRRTIDSGRPALPLRSAAVNRRCSRRYESYGAKLKARTILLAILLAAPAVHSTDETESSIGYSSYEEAMADLKASPSAEVSVQQGWTKVSVPAERTTWWFTPESHPAHPAVSKAQIVVRDGMVQMDTKLLCTAAKEDCDAMALQLAAWVQRVLGEFGNDS